VETSSAIGNVRVADANADIPTVAVPRERLDEGIWVVALFTEVGLARSNGEVRRLIKGGGCYVGDERVSDDTRTITSQDFEDGQLTLRAGKKNRRRIVLQ
jgi:tyrosyl-tRNA synthetase